ncbi:unnamed protein product [Phytophthora fragariaefolia]|uniref:Unnamed protein product n=1 Tax=Phytophthora fragariaefolia TaxID=1490495 RepID=A0A9W7D0I7_9STRA|nr:unnamed protein product [Phytophthora fragariaefolia]
MEEEAQLHHLPRHEKKRLVKGWHASQGPSDPSSTVPINGCEVTEGFTHGGSMRSLFATPPGALAYDSQRMNSWRSTTDLFSGTPHNQSDEEKIPKTVGQVRHAYRTRARKQEAREASNAIQKREKFLEMRRGPRWRDQLSKAKKTTKESEAPEAGQGIINVEESAIDDAADAPQDESGGELQLLNLPVDEVVTNTHPSHAANPLHPEPRVLHPRPDRRARQPPASPQHDALSPPLTPSHPSHLTSKCSHLHLEVALTSHYKSTSQQPLPNCTPSIPLYHLHKSPPAFNICTNSYTVILPLTSARMSAVPGPRMAGSCRLLGVALVVDDISKGCNLAFRYPAPSGESASSFHTLPAPLLAKLFRPKNALCNASFELVVDDLRFVSHPVLVSRRLPAAAPSDGSAAASGAPPTVIEQPGAAGSTGATGNETTMFNIIFALEDRPVQVSKGPEAFDGTFDTQLLPLQQADEEELLARRRSSAQAYHTVAAQLSNGLLHEELRVGFVSKEVRELLQLRDELAQSERNAGNNGTGIPGVTSGNSVSAAVAAGATSGGSLTSSTGGAGAATSGSSLHHHHHHRKDTESGSSTVEVDPQTLIDVSLGKSVLANDLKRVFHGLEESGAAHVVLNGWVKLSLTLTDAVTVRMASLRPYHTLLLLADKDDIMNKLPADHARQLRELVEAVNPLKSFQDLALETGVPIHQVFRLAAHLVYWGFGRIVDAITLYNIYQVNSKADLHITSLLAQEFRRKFAPYELGEVLSTFSGSRRIGEYMKTLSTTKKTEYIHMLIWLLQQRFIVQLHRYIYFMIPSDGDFAAEPNGVGNSVGSSSPALMASGFRRQRGNSSVTNTSAHGSVPIAQTPPMNPAAMALPSPPTAPLADDNPAADGRGGNNVPMAQVMSVASQLLFTDQERAYLAKIAKPNPLFTLFKRLCVYFHGEHHFEEIMWRENLSRGELRTVLSTYQDIIVCCLHE